MFLSDPRNNWSGQPQGLTYQRAIHALERYGHHAEVALLGRALLPILIRNGTFSQQLDPETGKPSLSNVDGYGPMILAMQEYVARLHGICIDAENGRIWWSGLSPAGWREIPDAGDDSRGFVNYTQKWGDYVFAMKLRRKGGLVAIVDGKEVFTAGNEVRVVTDLKGKVLAVVGADSSPREAHVEQAGQSWTGVVSPNEVWNCTADGLVLAGKAPFDSPYRRPGS